MKDIIKRLDQIKILFSQLIPTVAARITLAELFRRTFDANSIVTYSQMGEDRLIEYLLFQVLGDTRPGFYVDVGANDPFVKSNTMRLYLRGWHGLAIDANEKLIKKYKKYRPRDITVLAAISNEVRNATFQIHNDPAKSFVCHNKNFSVSKSGLIKIQTTTLTRIFEQYNIPKIFSLLNIDVEGLDFEVIRSFDLQKYRPRLIAIEMHGFDISCPQKNPIFSYLKNNNYLMHGYAGMNGYFIDNLILSGSKQ